MVWKEVALQGTTSAGSMVPILSHTDNFRKDFDVFQTVGSAFDVYPSISIPSFSLSAYFSLNLASLGSMTMKQ